LNGKIATREYFAERRITPDIRHVARYSTERIGRDKKAGKQRIFELFAQGYVRQTCKVAGMMRPGPGALAELSVPSKAQISLAWDFLLN